MAINLSEDNILVLCSITWCEHCAEQAATGLYTGVCFFDDGSLTPYRTNLCFRCSNGTGFRGATKIANGQVLSAKQRALAERWQQSLHD